MFPIIFHPDYQVPLPHRHKMPMSKYGHLRRILDDRGIMAPGGFVAPKQMGSAEIALAHQSDYVDRVFALRLQPGEVRRIGLPQSEQLLRRVRLSSGGTTLAGWFALEAGLACNAAGGSHHAAPGHGAGFCVLNDVAIAIRNLQAQGAVARALVVDADVHQGDGTAAIFADDPSVFTLSVHAERNFPVRKIPSDLDIGLPDNTGNDAYLTALSHGLSQAIAAAKPDIVFYNAGVDVHRDDRLGRLGLDDDGIRRREALVLETVADANRPLVTVLGGGYDHDPSVVAARHAILFEEAARLFARHRG